MTRLPAVARAVLVSTAIWVAPIQAGGTVAGDIRWVRGTVSASSSKSLSVTAGDRCLVLKMDSATEIVGPARSTTQSSLPIAPGTLVQAHFRTTDGRLAVVVIDSATASSSDPSWNREGRSVRGAVQRLTAGSVLVRFDRGMRELILDGRTTLLDREGRIRATGAKAIARLLAIGTDVLITWATDADGGASSQGRAVEIRSLTP
jgi:hypothetical protein